MEFVSSSAQVVTSRFRTAKTLPDFTLSNFIPNKPVVAM